MFHTVKQRAKQAAIVSVNQVRLNVGNNLP
jgi:hypothetical protein